MPWLHSASSSTARMDHSQRARYLVRQITDRINVNLVEQQCFLGRSPEDMSPWGLFFSYHICRAHLGSNQESSSSNSSGVVRSLHETFLAIDVRWNAAGISGKPPCISVIPNHWCRYLSPAPRGARSTEQDLIQN